MLWISIVRCASSLTAQKLKSIISGSATTSCFTVATTLTKKLPWNFTDGVRKAHSRSVFAWGGRVPWEK